VNTAGGFDWAASVRVPADQAVLEKFKLEPGDLMFNNTNSAELVGKSALVRELSEPVVYSNHFTRLRFADTVDPRYVAHWMRMLWQRKTFEHGCDRWVGQAAFQTRKLKELLLPLPPTITEQRLIADRLDESMTETAGARAALDRQIDDCSRLKSALIEEALGGRVIATNDPADQPGADWIALSSAARLESGHTPSRKRPEWWVGDVPWIALPDIRALDGTTVEATRETTNELGLANSSARLLPAGTVVLSRTASVGFVAVMGKPMATSQDFVNWVPGPTLRSWYLAYALIGARDYLRGLASGAVHKTIYMPTLKNLHLRLPSVGEQDRMIERIKSAHAFADNALTSMKEQSAALDALPAVLLSAAFRGEI
jgi:type I restriction enzyme S subunit